MKLLGQMPAAVSDQFRLIQQQGARVPDDSPLTDRVELRQPGRLLHRSLSPEQASARVLQGKPVEVLERREIRERYEGDPKLSPVVYRVSSAADVQNLASVLVSNMPMPADPVLLVARKLHDLTQKPNTPGDWIEPRAYASSVDPQTGLMSQKSWAANTLELGQRLVDGGEILLAQPSELAPRSQCGTLIDNMHRLDLASAAGTWGEAESSLLHDAVARFSPH